MTQHYKDSVRHFSYYVTRCVHKYPVIFATQIFANGEPSRNPRKLLLAKLLRVRYSLLTGIQIHMKNTNPDAPVFLNKADNHFKVLHNCLDVIFRRLCESNIGTSTVHHNPFTKEEIDQLWATGVLGTSNPRSLLNAVFFNNGMHFCLRGGDEHRRLKLDQIKREEMGYIYYENGSKNRKGTFLDRSVSNKVVKSERVPEEDKPFSLGDSSNDSV